ncbi:hypothetical protein JKP88DRAFT_249631 [Tribonema minus]|uniref:Uncharacterized protein n=1 Tax=Tribonema minus TaxID=303371 RepID=A0A835YLW1_9STRA|nr:hypothetical protein JKP88DRAFT_249631 [Tribonema minus]
MVLPVADICHKRVFRFKQLTARHSLRILEYRADSDVASVANGVAKAVSSLSTRPPPSSPAKLLSVNIEYYFKFSGKGVGGTNAQSAMVAITTPFKNSPLTQ